MGEGEGVRARIKKIWEKEGKGESEIKENKQKLYGRGGGRIREKENLKKQLREGQGE